MTVYQISIVAYSADNILLHLALDLTCLNNKLLVFLQLPPSTVAQPPYPFIFNQRQQ